MVSASKLAANQRWRQRNIEKVRLYKARWAREDRAKDPEKYARIVWRQRGMPEPTRPRPAACECCKRIKKLVSDHDHTTGKWRGWLCGRCNNGIGQLGDDVQGIIQAMAYMTRLPT